jgi:hypothetical protein
MDNANKKSFSGLADACEACGDYGSVRVYVACGDDVEVVMEPCEECCHVFFPQEVANAQKAA